jgi:hypothetical protein
MKRMPSQQVVYTPFPPWRLLLRPGTLCLLTSVTYRPLKARCPVHKSRGLHALFGSLAHLLWKDILLGIYSRQNPRLGLVVYITGEPGRLCCLSCRRCGGALPIPSAPPGLVMGPAEGGPGRRL